MLYLNEKSLALVTNVYNNMYSHYQQYDISMNRNDVSGSASIDILKQGAYVNKYYFYPDEDKLNGDIGSISIYGTHLQSHYETISKSRNIFGFKVKSIDLITQGTMMPFVDIYLEQ